MRCRTETEGIVAGAAQANVGVDRGFAWVPAIAETFLSFESDGETRPTFTDFLPEITKAFAREADRMNAHAGSSRSSE